MCSCSCISHLSFCTVLTSVDSVRSLEKFSFDSSPESAVSATAGGGGGRGRWTMGNIWAPPGQRERLCLLRLRQQNSTNKTSAATLAAVFSKGQRSNRLERHKYWKLGRNRKKANNKWTARPELSMFVTDVKCRVERGPDALLNSRKQRGLRAPGGLRWQPELLLQLNSMSRAPVSDLWASVCLSLCVYVWKPVFPRHVRGQMGP